MKQAALVYSLLGSTGKGSAPGVESSKVEDRGIKPKPTARVFCVCK